MRRRDFIARSGMAASAAMVFPGIAHARRSKQKQFIELRIYHFDSPEKRGEYEKFLEGAAIPAWNRAGVRPVGGFRLLMKDNPDLKLASDSTDLYIVLPHSSAESLVQLPSRLAEDRAFQQAGEAVLTAPKSDPAFTRYESSLMVAFEDFPQLKVPTTAPGRLVQLRIYESHNEERARKKIQMFNQGGEFAIFARSGMTGVFFGQTLIGSKLPNLTYMLSFPSEQEQKKGWETFRNDPEWKRLSKVDEYKDAVSNVTNLILRPIAGSQI
jgi:NIPSNAP protein